MKRKEFIQTSSLVLAGSLLSPLNSCTPEPKSTRINWAGNYTYKAKYLYQPRTIEEAQDLVKKLGMQKPLGSRHCFNNIADSPLNQISTRRLNRIISIDEENMTIEAEGGVRYGDLAPRLDEQGFALQNLASLPHITVVGACATATHGSGVANGNMATAVSALEIINGEGEVVKLNRDDGEKFNGAVVGLGALGLVTKVTLDIEKTYNVRQDVFQNLPLESLKNNFDAIMSSGYSVSLFSDWQNQNISQIWIKRRTDQEIEDLGNEFYGATAATSNLHPIVEMSPENCTEQLGVEGPWYDRLPHFKFHFVPSGGTELQSEYFVPRENAVEAILALEQIRDLIYPQLMISEFRTIAADNLWMSTSYKRDSVTLHFTWKQNWKEVKKILPVIESELAPFQARPHWGKMFTMDPKVLRSRYGKLPDFLQLIKEFDPEGKFRNDFLELNVL